MLSSDGVLFKLHRRNLGLRTEGFPDVDTTIPVQDEVVLLEEKASTLELLFQFVYPRRQPDLTKLEANELALLSEAAEKYNINSATQICMMCMQ